MARNPYPARWPSGNRPNVVSYQITSGQTYKAGELVVLSSQKIVVCGADPGAKGVLGVACDGAAPTYKIEQALPTPLGNVYLADDQTIWAISGSSAPANSNIGVDYGVVAASNVWTLDLTETSAVIFRVVDISTEQALFFVKFLTACCQIGGAG